MYNKHVYLSPLFNRSSSKKSKSSSHKRKRDGSLVTSNPLLSNITDLTGLLSKLETADGATVMRAPHLSAGKLQQTYANLKGALLLETPSSSSRRDFDSPSNGSGGFRAGSVSEYLSRPELVNGLATELDKYYASLPSPEEVARAEKQASLNRQM